MARAEPVVRIRPRSPEDGERCRRILAAAGLEPSQSLTWLVVREADPDAVNEALVAGGALSRVAARERIGRLVGWLLDRRGDLEGREANVRNLVSRVLSEAGLEARYRPRGDAELGPAGRELHAWLVAHGAGFVSWERFLALFCREA